MREALPQPLDVRLLAALKRLRQDNIELQKQVRLLQDVSDQGSCEELRSRVASLQLERQQWETQRDALVQLARRQAAELCDLREQTQRQRKLQDELEQTQAQARKVIVQHYQAMKAAQQQVLETQDELRRCRSQLEAIRRPITANPRKVLPPRGLRPMKLAERV